LFELLAVRTDLMIQSQTFGIMRDPQAVSGARHITSDRKLQSLFRSSAERNGLPVTTLEAIMNRKPVSPLKLNPGLPKDLEGILGRAMEKDRGHRYPNALAMKGDLQSLRKETESGLTKTGARRAALPYRIATSTFQTTSKFSTYLLVGVSLLLLTVLAAIGAWWFKQRQMAGAGAPKNTIAVLPLQNRNGDISVEFLRFALADASGLKECRFRQRQARPGQKIQAFEKFRRHEHRHLDARVVVHRRAGVLDARDRRRRVDVAWPGSLLLAEHGEPSGRRATSNNDGCKRRDDLCRAFLDTLLRDGSLRGHEEGLTAL